jgi:hypothetical protein
MTVTEMRKRVLLRAKSLSADQLRVADDFLAYLQERKENTATRELLHIPGFRLALRRAERDADAGRTVPLSKVRRDV